MSLFNDDDLPSQGYCQHVVNDKIYMLGMTAKSGAYTSPYLVCTDLEGNKLWSKIYTEYKQCRGGGDIIASHDGQLIMVERNAIPLQGDKAIIRKLDTLGNVIWKKIYGGNMSLDQLTNVCPLGSDKYFLQAHVDSVLYDPMTGGLLSDPPFAFILDEDGELLSEKLISNYNEIRYYTNTTCAKDGGVIASGGIRTGGSALGLKPNLSFGLITRFDSLGNILWDRFFWDPDYLRINPDTIFSSAFGPVVEMDDGRLAVVGLINGPQDKGGTNPWVLMLDSVGCLTPGCGDGEQIVTAVREPLPPSLYPVFLTPNPASGEVTIGFDSPVLLDAVASVVITDMSGRQVLYNVWPRGQSSLQLGIPHLSSGMYVVRLEDARGQLLAVQRLVVPAR
ncbi:MAG: T9SS type A sorting domain-containing protein [Lewinellaceae bacterium]|nr:T9SS type A sorting domain-containing protein [Lewinellaceae bacterium]